MFIQYLTNMHNAIIVHFSAGLKAQLKYFVSFDMANYYLWPPVTSIMEEDCVSL